MCGICGISGNLQDNMFILQMLLIANEERGDDATGFAYTLNGGKLVFNKAPLRASLFTSVEMGRKYNVDTDVIIGHTRAATSGSPQYNFNNHPFIAGDYCLVHNGIIWNDNELTKTHQLQRNSVTDSEVIPQLMNKIGWKKALEELEGSFSIAWINLKNPSCLYLARGLTGTVFYVAKYKHAILFSSVKDILEYLDLKPEVFPVNTWRIYKNGKLVSSGAFKSKPRTSIYSYYNKYNIPYKEYYYGYYDDVYYNEYNGFNYGYNKYKKRIGKIVKPVQNCQFASDLNKKIEEFYNEEKGV